MHSDNIPKSVSNQERPPDGNIRIVFDAEPSPGELVGGLYRALEPLRLRFAETLLEKYLRRYGPLSKKRKIGGKNNTFPEAVRREIVLAFRADWAAQKVANKEAWASTRHFTRPEWKGLNGRILSRIEKEFPE